MFINRTGRNLSHKRHRGRYLRPQLQEIDQNATQQQATMYFESMDLIFKVKLLFTLRIQSCTLSWQRCFSRTNAFLSSLLSRARKLRDNQCLFFLVRWKLSAQYLHTFSWTSPHYTERAEWEWNHCFTSVWFSWTACGLSFFILFLPKGPYKPMIHRFLKLYHDYFASLLPNIELHNVHFRISKMICRALWDC